MANTLVASLHTPGPWTTGERGTIWGMSVGGCRKELALHRIADVRGWGHLQYLDNGMEIQDANALLISKAPEMYDALKAIAERAARMGHSEYCECEDPHDLTEEEFKSKACCCPIHDGYIAAQILKELDKE